MPVFSWDEQGMAIINKGFGYYWAVTVPLTLLVLVSWSAAMVLPWKKWILRVRRDSETSGNDIELSATGA